MQWNYIHCTKKRIFFTYFLLENNIEDAETEVALNLICVNETTRQAIDIPIRPRLSKDLKNEVHKKHHRSHDANKIDIESKMKQRTDRSDFSAKSGKINKNNVKMIDMRKIRKEVIGIDWKSKSNEMKQICTIILFAGAKRITFFI